MKSSLLAAAISGMVMGAASLAHAATTTPQDTGAGSAQGTGAEHLDDHTAGKHSCKGKNDCKHQGGCKTDKHACKGQNDCKGQGGCKG
jgi:hypothetical protein